VYAGCQALGEHAGDAGLSLSVEGAGEDEYIDVPLGLAEESQPDLSGDGGPVGIGLENLGAGRLGRRPFGCEEQIGPQIGLVDAELVGDRPAVATMRDAAKADPTLDRLGVHGAGLRQLSDRKATTNHGRS
jgi:hypothetical protein